jgi:hypothetical protein
MTGGELVFDILFQSDTKKLKDLIKDLSDLNLNSIISSLGLKGLVDGITKVVDEAEKLSLSFRNLMGITGVSSTVFQKWDNAAKALGISAGVLPNTLADIQSSIMQLQTQGTGKATTWGALLGIDPRGMQDQPEEVLRRILQNLEGVRDPAMRRYLLQTAGLNENLVLMIGHWEDVQKAMANSEREMNQLSALWKVLTNIASTFASIIISIGAILTPVLGPISQIVLDIVNGFESLLMTIPKLASALASVAVILGGIALAMTAITGGVNLAALGITGGILGASALAGVLLPQFNPGGNSTDNSGDINVNNNFNVNGGNPDDVQDAAHKGLYNAIRDARNMGGQSNI